MNEANIRPRNRFRCGSRAPTVWKRCSTGCCSPPGACRIPATWARRGGRGNRPARRDRRRRVLGDIGAVDPRDRGRHQPGQSDPGGDPRGHGVRRHRVQADADTGGSRPDPVGGVHATRAWHHRPERRGGPRSGTGRHLLHVVPADAGVVRGQAGPGADEAHREQGNREGAGMSYRRGRCRAR